MPRIALLAVVIALAAAAPPAHASPTGGGTIFYTYQDLTWTMNSDGTGKASLPAGVSGSPSRALHGGHRWFLQLRDIPGESYPNSKTRREIFAVRDDGNAAFTKQLTNQPDLECFWITAFIGWKPGDGHIYTVARRWSGGAVVKGGVYAAEILFDGNGDVIGLSSQPAEPVITIPLVTWRAGDFFGGELAPDVYEMDWAPDGVQIVYARYSTPELRIADTSGGGRSLVQGSLARAPAWSPDGTKIAFSFRSGASDGISTIKPDGTGLKQIIKKGKDYNVGTTNWSPTGSHVAYRRARTTGIPQENDVYRAKADGAQQTNLTGDITGVAIVGRWR